MRFSPRYFALFLLLLLIEIFIAVAVHDSFVRPYLGDALVVVLLYCFVLAFCDLGKRAVAVGVFLFACCIELAQYANIVSLLGLEDNGVMRVIIGTHFAPLDFVAYLGGVVLVVLLEVVLVRLVARTAPG
jgi:hypothetical protein